MIDKTKKELENLVLKRFKNKTELDKYFRRTFYSDSPIKLELSTDTDHEEQKHDYEYTLTLDNGDFLCDITVYTLLDRLNYIVITEIAYEFER